MDVGSTLRLLVGSVALMMAFAIAAPQWAAGQSAAELERARQAYEAHLKRMEEADRAPPPAAKAPPPKAMAPAPMAPKAAAPAPMAPKAAAPAPMAPKAAAPAAAPKALSISAADQDAATERGLEQYRRMMKEDPWGNPAFLDVDRGEASWAQKRGLEDLSLADVCDLGKGVGKVDGAFAEMPRYFADAERVMDAETRVMWCMEKLLGVNLAAFRKSPHPGGGAPVKEIGAIGTFIASKSAGVKFSAPKVHVKEQEAIALGEALFFRRQGPFDFSCATCHAESGKRIRLQPLPWLSSPKEAKAMAEWPAYRVSNTHVMTMQHRLLDCYWQMRLHRLDVGSEASVALTAYLHQVAQGVELAAPGLKR